MMLVIAFTLLAAALFSYSAFVLTVFGVAIFLLLHSVNLDLTINSAIAFLLLILLVPGAAVIAGLILDRCCGLVKSSPLFAHVGFIAAGAMAFRSEMALDYIESALLIALDGNIFTGTLWIVSLLSAMFFCGGLVAFSLMMLVWLIEMPIAWYSRAGSYSVSLSFSSLRPIIIIVGVALSFNLMVGLFSSQLWPSILIGN